MPLMSSQLPASEHLAPKKWHQKFTIQFRKTWSLF